MKVQNGRRQLCPWRPGRKELPLRDVPAQPGLPPPDIPGPRIPEGCVCWDREEEKEGGGEEEEERTTFPMMLFNHPRLEIGQGLRHCPWLW